MEAQRSRVKQQQRTKQVQNRKVRHQLQRLQEFRELANEFQLKRH